MADRNDKRRDRVIKGQYRGINGNIVDGYVYFKEKTGNDGSLYLSCSLKKKGYKCRGIRNANGRLTVTHGHNHASSETAELKRNHRLELIEKIEQTTGRSNKDVYDKVRPNHPDAAAEVPYLEIERSMRRWRRNFQRPIPEKSLFPDTSIKLDLSGERMKLVIDNTLPLASTHAVRDEIVADLDDDKTVIPKTTQKL